MSMTEEKSNSNNNNPDDDGGNSSSLPPITTAMVTTSRIAFGSCHKGEKSATPPIWETILPPKNDNGEANDSESEHEPLQTQTTTRLDAWLWLGDAMYPSHRDPITHKKYYGPAPPEEIKAGLKAMKHENATIGYKDFLERLTEANNNNNNHKKRSTHTRPLVTGVWDDHDFGGNDMGYGMPSKPERQIIYRDFLGHPLTNAPRTPWSASRENNNNNKNSNANSADHQDFSSSSSSHDEGMYHRVDLEGGRIRILVLDTRWFREDHCIPSVAHSIPKGNAVACLTRWLTSVRSLCSWISLQFCIVDHMYFLFRGLMFRCKTFTMQNSQLELTHRLIYYTVTGIAFAQVRVAVGQGWMRTRQGLGRRAMGVVGKRVACRISSNIVVVNNIGSSRGRSPRAICHPEQHTGLEYESLDGRMGTLSQGTRTIMESIADTLQQQR